MKFQLVACGLLLMFAVAYCTQDTVTNADRDDETSLANRNNSLIRRPRSFWSFLKRAARPFLAIGRTIKSWFKPAVETVNVAHEVYKATQPDHQKEILRMQRELVKILYQMMANMQNNRYSRQRRSSNLCLSSRVSIIGTNLDLARQLNSRVQDSDLKHYISLDERGFSCDAGFCQNHGDGHFGLGLCSNEYCHCANGIPYPKQCGEGTVYDPTTETCNWCGNVAICAMWSNQNQIWTMKHDGTIARQNSNKCVDNRDWSTNNGGLIQQWDCAITTNQQWKIEPAPGSTDRAFIMNIHSRKCMQIKGISYDNGAQIEQWDCSFHSPHANQLWTLVDGHLMNINSGKCLDATGGSHDNGVILQQWDCS